jgi:outer membrane protein
VKIPQQRRHLLAALCLSASAASPVCAQAGDRNTANGPDKYRITLVGAATPDYVGSDEYTVVPGPEVRGTFDGFNFETVGTSFDVDLIRDNDRSVDLQFGPVIGLNLNRTSDLNGFKDARVAALGKLKRAVEVGAYVGVAKTGIVTSAYDTLAFSVSVQKDVAGAHESFIIAPTLDYGTPLSKRTYVDLSASAQFVGDRYNRYYFGVGPAGASVSGLSSFGAKGGLEQVGLTLTALQSLSSDLRKGWSLVTAIGYTRLTGDAARSPIVSVAGDRNQWLAALGVSYAFK